ncbi:MAG: ATP-grasp domain-containing protein [Fuerstiella sp.]
MPDRHHNAHLIIAGASVRSLAQSSIAAGLRPICIDLFSDSDLHHLLTEAGLPADHMRLIKSFDQLESELETIDGNIPLVPVGGLELASGSLNRIRSLRPVFAMTSDVTEQLKNSQVIFPHLKAAGHSVPNFYPRAHNVCREGDSTSQVESHLEPPRQASSPEVRWLKKDGLSSGGQSVIQIDNRHWQQHAENLQPSEYLQEEVEGIPCSATFLATVDANESAPNHPPRLLGCSMQICGEPALNAHGFQFCGNAGPVRFSQTTEAELRSIAATLQQRWRLQGAFGIDFIWTSGNVSVIEINPRLTASHEIIESSTANSGWQILEHCLQFDPAVFSDFSSGGSNPHAPNPHDLRTHNARTHVRLILYSQQTFQLPSQQQQAMLQMRGSQMRGAIQPAQTSSRRPATESTTGLFWLSDIPEAGATIEAGAPFCSLNFAADHAIDLTTTWKNLCRQPRHSFLKLHDVTEHDFTEMVTTIQNQLVTLQNHHESSPATEPC